MEQSNLINCRKCLNPRCNNVFPESYVDQVNEKKYCSRTCGARHVAYLNWLKVKDTEEYKERQRNKMKEWYQENKQHQNENVKKYYFLHKDKWRIRSKNNLYRKDILNLFNNRCSCGSKENLIIKNLNYEKVPSRHNKEDWNKFILKNRKVICKSCILKNGDYKRCSVN